MDRGKLESYLARLNDFSRFDAWKQVDYFAYFLIDEMKEAEFKAKDIDTCFELANMKKYSRLPVYLSEQAGKRDGKYVKTANGYTLERGTLSAIRRDVQHEPETVRVAETLLDMILKVTEPNEKSYLEESLNCYRVQAFRATIVMTWALTLHHLREYIIRSKVADFNLVLSKNNDKRIRISEVKNPDDFNEIPDDKFIEFCRAAGIISKDVRKILDEKLGTRNSAAHPSGIRFGSHKATEFAADLLTNVILKY